MADSNETQGFWNSWFGKIAALFGLIWVLPTDNIFNDIVDPGMGEMGKRFRNGFGHAKGAIDASSSWLKHQMKRLFRLTLFIGGISGALLYLGLSESSRTVVVASGIVWVLYLVFLWVLIKGSVKTIASAISASSNIATSTGGAILRKVGLTEGDGENFKVKFENIDEILGKGYILLPAFAEGFFLLALVPSLSSLLVLAILAIGAMASGFIAAHIDDSMVDGWKLVKRINFVLFVIMAIIGVLAFFMPQSFAKFANPGKFDTWLMDPNWSYGWVGTCIAIGIGATVLWIIAGRVEGETGKRLTKAIPALAVVAMVVTVVMMSSASGKVESAYDTVAGKVSQQSASDTTSKTRPSAPNPGAANGMKMPGVDYKTVGYEPKKRGSKPVAKSPNPPAPTKPVVHLSGDGYDQAEAFLNEVGL